MQVLQPIAGVCTAGRLTVVGSETDTIALSLDGHEIGDFSLRVVEEHDVVVARSECPANIVLDSAMLFLWPLVVCFFLYFHIDKIARPIDGYDLTFNRTVPTSRRQPH
jgi:hypothetical protein